MTEENEHIKRLQAERDAALAVIARHEASMANEGPCAHRIEAERLEAEVDDVRQLNAVNESACNRALQLLEASASVVKALTARVAELEEVLICSADDDDIRTHRCGRCDQEVK